MDTVAEAVDRAMRAVPREDFLPVGERSRASYDGPLPIGRGQTNSQPRTVADTLRLLAAEPGQRVLDVGSGSGWTTALLAELVGPEGSVIGVEIEPDLVTFGRDNVRRACGGASAGSASVRIEQAGETLGWPDEAPYDRILVSAETGALPHELAEQLADEGRMVIPVNGRLLLVERDGDEVRTSEHGWYRFVPLR